MNDVPKADFRRASACNADNACVEVARFSNGDVAVRDSKDGGRGPVLQFDSDEWDVFLYGAVNGEFGEPPASLPAETATA